MKPRTDDIERAFDYLGKANPVVLEIGCGSGRDATEILKHTEKYIGIDAADKLLQYARKNAPEGTFITANLESYNIPDGIDIIFAFASLLHSPAEQLRLFFDKAAKALNQSGIIYISLKYREQYQEETKTTELGTKTFYYYSPEIIERLAGADFISRFSDVHDFNGQKAI